MFDYVSAYICITAIQQMSNRFLVVIEKEGLYIKT